MSFVVIQGDCLEVMDMMPSDSVDSIVTDPPYGLNFMGKDWDHGVPGAPFWQQALRVAKPGAHLLAAGGSRTFHRLVVAIEDAGWEIRDTVLWVYGCLSEDTEILVEGQWERFNKTIDGKRVLCYIPEYDKYEWQTVQETIEYDYDDTAFRIHGDRTDQIVSRNHRCLVERGGGYTFQLAETLERQARVPVLESVQNVLEAVPLPHEGTSRTKQVLLQNVHPEKSGEEKTYIRTQGQDSCLCGMREGVLEAGCVVAKSEACVLLASLSSGGCDGADSCGKQVRQDRNEVSRHGFGRRGQPGVEGRRNLLPQARELQTDQVRSVSGGVLADGAEGRLCHGTPAICRSGDGAVSVTNGSSAPSEPRPTGQSAGESGAVRQQSGAQAARGTGHTRSDLARVEPIQYKGRVWCVRVPSGAFVARRNGKVFVTGNSGFPKSLDVAKAIDKAAGAERPVVGESVSGGYKRLMETNAAEGFRPEDYYPEGNKFTSKEPVTEAAKQWNGWGTALKPAFEPWVLARKPLEGTVVQNVQKWGTGALNIDRCRVPTGDDTTTRHNSSSSSYMTGKIGEEQPKQDEYVTGSTKGRWPANFIHDGSDEVVSLFPESKGQAGDLRAGIPKIPANCFGQFGPTSETPKRGDTGSAARFFYVPKASVADREDGLRDGGVGALRDGGRANTSPRANFHPTVKPTELMRYLCRLVTPPNGVVLDPFAGSGSTGRGALFEGFKFIGIEKEQAYVEIAKKRIEAARAAAVTG